MDLVAKEKNQNEAKRHENKIQKRHFLLASCFGRQSTSILKGRSMFQPKSRLLKVLCITFYPSLWEQSNSSSHSFWTGLLMKKVDNNISFSVSSGVQGADDLEFRA